MRINIELTEKELRELVLTEIDRRLGDVIVPKENVSIQVKSKQNWKSEWEEAAFRATVIVDTSHTN